MKKYFILETYKEHWHNFKALLLVLSIALVFLILRNSSYGLMFSNYELMRQKISADTIWGPFIFICIGTIATSVGFPRVALAALAGFIFGFTKGFVFALVSSWLGCVITFYYARLLGKAFIEKRFSDGKLNQYNKWFSKNTFAAVLMIRFFPVGNNTVTNLIGGVSKAKAVPFFIASIVAFIPQTIIFALAGSGIRKETWFRGGVSIALFVMSILVMLYLYKKRNIRELE